MLTQESAVTQSLLANVRLVHYHILPSISIRTIGASKMGGGHLLGDGCLLGRLRYMYHLVTEHPLPPCSGCGGEVPWQLAQVKIYKLNVNAWQWYTNSIWSLLCTVILWLLFHFVSFIISCCIVISLVVNNNWGEPQGVMMSTCWSESQYILLACLHNPFSTPLRNYIHTNL